ncbi:hypothetical protein GCM10007036_33030 [Alsobacter metallidurans]|uniref:Transglycosylase SLT domain-containing protein n=1 Tax=Alsobacter metallidurans TaxID=340221 RepID=A0A917MIF1_9HYPH|nr:lytic transglycosylase domain-containing protein [Alsobacter metallidurans]GGH25731.1 hypothetical protein GCM10007036_33030 [Alsobacter metallidurans]
MFLFTTPAVTPEPRPLAPAAQTPVVDAIKTGSAQTGTDFGYLLQTAQRESSLVPDAKAKNSSATGLFQFIEQTWLGLVKSKGASYGLGAEAQAISEGRSGRLDVADPAAKQQILGLRNDPRTAALMAGEFTRQNAATLASALGRQPTSGELYAAHFMGAGGAAELARRAQTTPQAVAAEVFPDQAAANKAVFTDKATGRPKTVSELYASLVKTPAAADPISSDPSTWAAAQPATLATAYARQDGPRMHGLFRTEGDRSPMNQTVAKLWTGLPSSRAASDAPSYFPRTASLAKATATDAVAAAPMGAAPASGASAGLTVPLPPERPPEFSIRPAVARHQRAPLDLLSFRVKGAS